MSNPFFSVIIPAYNAEERIRTGLDSIMEQTFEDYELIVVCDDCHDRTAEIAREYTDKVIEVGWHNCGMTRNRGLDEATGDWILWMDDDDQWNDDMAFRKIAQAILDNDQDFDVLAFDFVFKGRGIARQGPEKKYIAIWNKAWKREFLERIGARFPEVPHSDDVGFAEATHGKARFRFLHEVLYYYNYLRIGSITYKLKTGELKRLEDMGLR